MVTTWPDLATLELLVALADEGSLSPAARRCGVAQPNASRSIARLERGLGLADADAVGTAFRTLATDLMAESWTTTVPGRGGRPLSEDDEPPVDLPPDPEAMPVVGAPSG